MKRSVFLIFIIFISFNLFSQNKKYIIPSSDVDKWYSRGVFYELFVRSFKDSNGDKNGDFRGVIEKIDYLKALGISGIWFMPITDSAEKTNNYDPIDYMNVDPTYGTLDDFKELLKKCHENGIRVIIDFVVNHTSDKHPFFIDAMKNKNSKYRNWYIWSETEPTGSWKKYWYKTETGWYYAYFINSKPDLNYKNPEVINYMKSVMKFWLDLGVDGFRFDAVTLLVENGENAIKHQPESFQIYREFRKFVEENYKDRDIFFVAESESPYIDYLGNGKDMFHSVFDFKINNTIIRTLKDEAPIADNGANMIESIVVKYTKDLKNKDGGFLATLLSNHDSYAGVRPFRQFEENIDKCKLAGSIYLTLPGIPFIYYGEEIGMDTTPKFKGDRFLRVPMQWDDSENAGFTTANKAWLGVNENYKDYNVAKFEKDNNSILNHYRNLVKIRKENKSLSLGTFQTLSIVGKNNKVIGYLREFDNEKTIVILNFDKKKYSFIKFDLTGTSLEKSDAKVTQLLGENAKIEIKKGILSISNIANYGTIIIKVE
ncbi:MAG TPA: alpha-amylase family glycosyl hydrolase [Spirochaetota bacterium]|nr:alpha-amylase family glycosyl hydrolase [Spirochaetota bacterium]HOL55934.1 alpha-amylase family glycosyl hydrolase [Spirochaetota bacterium]HPP03240.1 alpha-amylase family glycosyl hydrolase [Spirochaetota bacterium]